MKIKGLLALFGSFLCFSRLPSSSVAVPGSAFQYGHRCKTKASTLFREFRTNQEIGTSATRIGRKLRVNHAKPEVFLEKIEIMIAV